MCLGAPGLCWTGVWGSVRGTVVPQEAGTSRVWLRVTVVTVLAAVVVPVLVSLLLLCIGVVFIFVVIIACCHWCCTGAVGVSSSSGCVGVGVGGGVGEIVIFAVGFLFLSWSVPSLSVLTIVCLWRSSLNWSDLP